ncbi:LuxR family transcriptional regulator [Caulobacter sp. S45]|uniref:helix-turn-helix transcriptional regulator n=1 Tax=Caulobacter sp. S45 TaxID=1641861 RepID=UPI0020B15609|nr:LuxR family transcriptional regulator [Caulobacter sp. S45]
MTYEAQRGLAKRVFDTLRAAPEAQTFQELTDVFKPTVNDMGFTYFSVVEASVIPKNRTLNVLFGQPDAAWVDVYDRERLAGVDPRMRHMLGSAEPAFLSELAPRHEVAEDQLFLARFGSYGHTDCYVWPVHLPEGGVRAVLMVSDAAELGIDARTAAGALASAFHAAGAKLLRRLKAARSGGVELRPRQLECLYWARQGKSSADIGHILGISARTVDEHIGHACEALGVRTRIQAVARAVVLGLF